MIVPSVVDNLDQLKSILDKTMYTSINHVDPINTKPNGDKIVITVMYTKAWNGVYVQHTPGSSKWEPIKWPFF